MINVLIFGWFLKSLASFGDDLATFAADIREALDADPS